MTPLASVVIPAHNEERVITRTLTLLHEGLRPGALDVVVVCNGCTDGTARAARATGLPVHVVELSEPSKAKALRVGDARCVGFPRVHLDGDVQLRGSDLAALVRPLRDEGLLATAPRRVVDRERSSPLVRGYYDLWEQLPQVRSGLFGRGVIALSAAGQARVAALPDALSDDLVASDAFEADERRVVDEVAVVVVAPRTLRDLVRRRVRVATGNAQADRAGLRRPASATRPRTLAQLLRSRPRLATRLPVFVAVSILARLSARGAVRRGDVTTWLRDESSRD